MPVARIVQRCLPILFSLLALFTASPAARAQGSSGVERTGSRTWWLPEDVSTFGYVDELFYFILWMTVIVGIAVFIVMGVFLVKYRYKPNRTAIYIHGNNKIELVWTIVPALLMAATAAISQSTWAMMKNPADWPSHDQMLAKVQSGEVVYMEVVAKQFNWVYHYPGADGLLGPRSAELIADSAELHVQVGHYSGANVIKLKTGETLHGMVKSEDKKKKEITFRLDSTHTDRVIKQDDIASTESWGKDDVYTSFMVAPVNKKIYIQLSSIDVLHSFFLPNMRVKQDAVPGLSGKVWFEARKLSKEVIGEVAPDDAIMEQRKFFQFAKPYEILCAELCGLGHSGMKGGALYIVQDEDYRRWLKEQPTVGGDEF